MLLIHFESRTCGVLVVEPDPLDRSTLRLHNPLQFCCAAPLHMASASCKKMSYVTPSVRLFFVRHCASTCSRHLVAQHLRIREPPSRPLLVMSVRTLVLLTIHMGDTTPSAEDHGQSGLTPSSFNPASFAEAANIVPNTISVYQQKFYDKTNTPRRHTPTQYTRARQGIPTTATGPSPSGTCTFREEELREGQRRQDSEMSACHEPDVLHHSVRCSCGRHRKTAPHR